MSSSGASRGAIRIGLVIEEAVVGVEEVVVAVIAEVVISGSGSRSSRSSR